MSDNSNTGYVVLGLIYASTPLPHGFGLPIPQFVKDELNIWIDYIQNDVDGDTNDGGSGYDGPDSWVNILKTGTLLQEMAFVGDTLATPRVQDAIAYIERHWNEANVDPGWKGGGGWPLHKQAMYTTMKGFEAFSINLIDTDGDGDRNDDWFNEFADALLEEQALFPEGHWDWDPWAEDYVLPTCWALLVLERAAPPVARYDLTVHVTNANTGDPISGARVDVTGPESRTDYTDPTGTVVFFDLLAGDYSVAASADGYYPESTDVHLDEDKIIEIRLRPIEVGVPEFPLGITILMSLGGAIYILAKRKLKQ
jgi:hypothetical protein